MTKQEFLYYYEYYCGSNIANIVQITTDNHAPLYVDEYLNTPGRGIRFINDPIAPYATGTVLQYVFTPTAENVNTFTIPTSTFSSVNNDTLYMFYQGLKLELGVNYTMDINTNIVTLGFTTSASDTNNKISCLIIKGGEASTSSYTYMPATTNTTSFVISLDNFSPLLGDAVMLFYKGLKLDEGINYTLDKYTNTVTLGFSISSAVPEDYINYEIFRNIPVSELTGNYLTGFLIYGKVAPSGAKHGNQMAEWFLPIENVQGLGHTTMSVPLYVNN